MFRAIWLYLLQCLGFDPRGIFRYWNGSNWCNADPMDLTRRLWSVEIEQRERPEIACPALPFDSGKSRKLIRSGNGIWIVRGYAEVAEAVREAFQIKAFDNGGLNEVECDQLLARFEAYQGDLKKNISPSPISPTNTESNGESATNADSLSGSSSTEKCYEVPDVSGLV